MPDINPSVPVVGQPDSTEEPKVVTALTQLIAAVNDVDSDQIADGTIALVDLATALQDALPSSGDLKVTAYDTADPGWLLCDGAAVSRATYAALFAKISTTYGAGDGTTTFNVPDFQGRMPVGKGTNAVVDTVGKNDGTALANRSPKHWHDADALTANVYLSAASPTGGGIVSVGRATSGNPAFTAGGLVDILGDVGVTTGTQDAPSFLVVHFQIKT